MSFCDVFIESKNMKSGLMWWKGKQYFLADIVLTGGGERHQTLCWQVVEKTIRKDSKLHCVQQKIHLLPKTVMEPVSPVNNGCVVNCCTYMTALSLIGHIYTHLLPMWNYYVVTPWKCIEIDWPLFRPLQYKHNLY